MYIEISPRRTGKTTRMLKEMQRQHGKGFRPVLMVPSMRMGREMMARMMPPGDAKKFEIINRHEQWGELERGMRSEYNRLFVDEFDCIQAPARIPILETGYYCGTTMRGRSIAEVVAWKLHERLDNMLDLLQMNGWHYTSHSPIQMLMRRSVESLENLGDEYPNSSTFENEMLGNWLRK